ncbi:MAG: hypothetical protein HQ574_00450 [Chloroflexi bacterium]|nr:hypothetical protein [Chloroflexota bacterium]
MDKLSFSLRSANIVIIGLGLMDSSLMLSREERCKRLSALDSYPSILELTPHA